MDGGREGEGFSEERRVRGREREGESVLEGGRKRGRIREEIG